MHAETSRTATGGPNEEFGAAVGGPLIQDRLAFRASAWIQQNSGFVNSLDHVTGATVDTDTNWNRSAVARLALKWKITDVFAITPSFFYQDVYTHNLSWWWLSDGGYPGTATTAPPSGAAGKNKNLDQSAEPDSDHFSLADLSAECQFDEFSVNLIASYFQRSDNRLLDESSNNIGEFTNGATYLGDGQPYTSADHFANSQNNATAELRFSSKAAFPYSWNIGFFSQHAKQTLAVIQVEPNLVNLPNDPAINAANGLSCKPGSCTVGEFFGTPLLPGNIGYINREILRVSEVAAYFNASYRVTKQFNLEAGVRYALSKFDFMQVQTGPWNTHLTSDRTLTAESVNSGQQREHPATPRFSASYDITDDAMVYATAAKGYRIGGANQDLSSVLICGHIGNPHTYKSDSLWSYEFGAKAKLFDSTLRVDAAAFFISWKDIQSVVTVPACGQAYTDNLGTARSVGGEAAIDWTPTKNWLVSANVGYTNARYTQDALYGTSTYLAKNGQSLGVPEWTYALSVKHSRVLSDVLTSYVRGDYQYQGSYQRNGDQGTLGYDSVTHHADAVRNFFIRSGIETGPWDLSLYVQNLFNSQTALYLYRPNSNSTTTRQMDMIPRTIGVSVDYNF
jgi:outer membrane receptor protein involved in Fe transport